MVPTSPFQFNTLEFQRQQLEEAQIRETTILSLSTWDGHWLVAGTSTGHLILWNNLTSIQNGSNESKFHLKMISTVYDLKTQSNLLLCGTESGLVVYNWEQLTEAALNVESEVCPVLQLPMSIGVSRVISSPPECNALVVDAAAHTIWAAAGDGITCGVGNKLYSACLAPNTSTLFVGGESGKVSLFDTRSCDKELTHFQVAPGGWISSLIVDEDANWLTCAGGLGDKGHLSLWHTPMATRLSNAVAPVPINALRYHDDALVSVGGESFVTYWDVHPSSGDRGLTSKGRTASSAPSLFALHPIYLSSGTPGAASALVVGGAAPLVDFYMTPSSKTMSLYV